MEIHVSQDLYITLEASQQCTNLLWKHLEKFFRYNKLFLKFQSKVDL